MIIFLFFCLTFRSAITQLSNTCNLKESTVVSIPKGSQALVDFTDQVVAAQFSPSGTFLAAGGLDYRVQVYVVGGGFASKVQTLYGSAVVSSVAFSPSEDFLAVGSYDGTVSLYGLSPGNVNTTAQSKQFDTVVSLAFHPLAAILAVGTYTGHILFLTVPGLTVLQQLTAAQDMISSLAYTATGRGIYTASWDTHVSLLLDNSETSTPNFTVTTKFTPNPGAKVNVLALSQDNTALAVGCNNSWVYIYSVLGLAADTPVLKQQLGDATGEIKGLAFSSSGALLAAGSADAHTYVYSVGGPLAQLSQTLDSRGGSVWSVDFDQETNLAIACANKLVTLYSLADSRIKSLDTVVTGNARVSCTAFEPQGMLLFVANTAKQALLYQHNLQTGQAVLLSGSTLNGTALVAHFHPTKPLLFLGLDSKQLLVYQLNGLNSTLANPIQAFPLKERAQGLACNRQGDQLAVVTFDGEALLYPVTSQDSPLGSPAIFTLKAIPYAVLFHPYLPLLFVARHDSQVSVHELPSFSVIQSLSGTVAAFVTLALNFDGSVLVAGTDTSFQALMYWVPEDGRNISLVQVLANASQEVNAVAFHPDGDLLLLASEDQNLYAYAVTGRGPGGLSAYCFRIVSPTAAPLTTLEFDPSGTALAVGSGDGKLPLFAVVPATAVSGPYVATREAVSAVELSPDGRRLVLGEPSGAAALFDVVGPAAHPRQVLQPAAGANPGATTAAAFSADGSWLAVCGSGPDGLAIYRVTASGAAPQQQLGVAGVAAVAFSASAAAPLLLLGGASGTALFRVEAAVAPLWVAPAPVTAACFAPADRFLATGDATGAVRVYPVSTGGTAPAPLQELAAGAAVVDLSFAATTDVLAAATAERVVLFTLAGAGGWRESAVLPFGGARVRFIARQPRLVVSSPQRTAVYALRGAVPFLLQTVSGDAGGFVDAGAALLVCATMPATAPGVRLYQLAPALATTLRVADPVVHEEDRTVAITVEVTAGVPGRLSLQFAYSDAIGGLESTDADCCGHVCDTPASAAGGSTSTVVAAYTGVGAVDGVQVALRGQPLCVATGPVELTAHCPTQNGVSFYLDGAKCTPCPHLARCYGTARVDVAPGAQRRVANATDPAAFFECAPWNSASCAGGDGIGHCAEGYREGSFACTLCADGYGGGGREPCHKCYAWPVATLFWVLRLAGVLLYVVCMVNDVLRQQGGSEPRRAGSDVSRGSRVPADFDEEQPAGGENGDDPEFHESLVASLDADCQPLIRPGYHLQDKSDSLVDSTRRGGRFTAKPRHVKTLATYLQTSWILSTNMGWPQLLAWMNELGGVVVVRATWTFQCLAPGLGLREEVYGILGVAGVLLALGLTARALAAVPRLAFAGEVGLLVCICAAFLLYPTLVSALAEVPRCVEVGGRSFALYAFDRACDDPSHQSLVRVAWPALVASGALPLLLLLLALRGRGRFYRGEGQRLFYAMLFQGYSQHGFFWEVVVLYRKFFLLLVSRYFLSSDSGNLTLFLMLFILCAELFAVVVFRPYLRGHGFELAALGVNILKLLWAGWCATPGMPDDVSTVIQGAAAAADVAMVVVLVVCALRTLWHRASAWLLGCSICVGITRA